METKLSTQDLAVSFAEQQGITQKKALDFIQTVFNIVDDFIQTEKIVKIKGFGTFKMIEVMDRESINVSTGERIRIAGHNKVTFTPDAQLKDAVNRPFSEFETVILNDGVDMSKIESIDNNTDADDVEDTDQNVEIPVTTEIAPEPAPVVEIEPEPVAEPEPAPVVEIEPEPVVEPESAPVVEIEPEPVAVPKPVAEPEPAPVVESEPEKVVTVTTQNVANQRIDELNVGTQHVEHQTIQQITSQNKDCQAKSASTSTAMMVALFTSLVLILMALSFYAGMKFAESSLLRVSQMEKEEVVMTKETATPAKKAEAGPVKKAETTPVKKAEPAPVKKAEPSPAELAAKYPQVPDGEYWIVGEQCIHEMSTGENLYRIAGKELGSQKLMNYIVVFNQFERPDVIPLGYKIRIPKLVKKQ